MHITKQELIDHQQNNCFSHSFFFSIHRYSCLISEGTKKSSSFPVLDFIATINPEIKQLKDSMYLYAIQSDSFYL